MNRVSINEWFDPENHDHLKAYRHLMQKGSWPIDFIPGNVTLSTNWRTELDHKIVEEYLSLVLDIVPLTEP